MWEELYRSHHDELTAYGARISGNRELAEDLAQETFIKALVHMETLEDLSPNQRRAWLYRVFKNLFFDRCRRAALENEYERSLQPETAEDRGIQEIENAMLLQSISPQDREIFQLRYFDGYTSAEISRMLDLPPGTIRSRLSRCRRFLRENLDGGN